MYKNYMMIAILMISLTACNQNQQNHQGIQFEKLDNRNTPNYKNISNNTETNNNSEQSTEQINDTAIPNNQLENDDVPENEVIIENDDVPENEVIIENDDVPENEVIIENDDVSENEVIIENDNVSENEVIINQQDNQLNPSSQKAFPLSVTDFQQRWNAISEEHTGDVYINHLQPKTDPTQHQAILRDRLVLEIHTLENNQINRIKIIGIVKTNAELLKMLTSWWQVLLITNPQSELHEIDTIFSKIGIGPNSHFNDIQPVSLLFGGLQYKVIPSQEHILFEAIYPNS